MGFAKDGQVPAGGVTVMNLLKVIGRVASVPAEKPPKKRFHRVFSILTATNFQDIPLL